MKKILVIDDHKDNLISIKAIIKINIPNCTVLSALSGKEGIKLAKKEQPDTILLDIIMPEIDGFEVCRRLKEDNATKDIPIIFITAIKTDLASKAKGLEMGADAFLSKPIEPIELCAQLNVMFRIKEAEDKLRQEKTGLEENLKDRNTELLRKNKELESEIANRKKLEETFRRERDKFSFILDELPIGVSVLDADNKFIYINPISRKIDGYPKDSKSIINNHVTDVHPKKNKSVVEQLIKEFKSGKKSSFTRESKRGKRMVEVSYYAIRDSKEKYMGLVRLVSDITERKKAEDTLKKSEEKIRNIFENSTIVHYSHDLDHVVTYVSPHVENMLGYTPEEMKVKWTTLATDNPINELAYRNTFKAIETGERQPTYELEFLHKNGKKVCLEAYEAPIVKNGKTISIVGSFSDITERKKAELELFKAKEKAEESDRLKSSFLANMSHEIRTPMNGILGFTDLLKEPKLSGEDQERYISVIEKSGHRLLSTVNDLIDISKIESDQMKVTVSKVDISMLNKELLTFFNAEAQKKELKLFLSTSSLANCVILTDQEKMYSILSNLIKNAIKYTLNGQIEFGYSRKGNFLQFFVKDSGAGIPFERLEIIFDRFIRNDLREDSFIEGSGLGLSISKAYVEMLGGKIWVESEVGIGSQFYFTIPYKVDNKKHIENIEVGSESKTTAHLENLKILIAEDDEAADNLLSIHIRNISKEIIHTKSGVKAVNICRNSPDIDLILMDIQMPELNGYKATKEIRKFNKNVIIIAQTAYAIAGDREKALESGCNDYITKPINKKELLEKIERNLIKK